MAIINFLKQLQKIKIRSLRKTGNFWFSKNQNEDKDLFFNQKEFIEEYQKQLNQKQNSNIKNENIRQFKQNSNTSNYKDQKFDSDTLNNNNKNTENYDNKDKEDQQSKKEINEQDFNIKNKQENQQKVQKDDFFENTFKKQIDDLFQNDNKKQERPIDKTMNNKNDKKKTEKNTKKIPEKDNFSNFIINLFKQIEEMDKNLNKQNQDKDKNKEIEKKLQKLSNAQKKNNQEENEKKETSSNKQEKIHDKQKNQDQQNFNFFEHKEDDKDLSKQRYSNKNTKDFRKYIKKDKKIDFQKVIQDINIQDLNSDKLINLIENIYKEKQSNSTNNQKVIIDKYKQQLDQIESIIKNLKYKKSISNKKYVYMIKLVNILKSNYKQSSQSVYLLKKQKYLEILNVLIRKCILKEKQLDSKQLNFLEKFFKIASQKKYLKNNIFIIYLLIIFLIILHQLSNSGIKNQFNKQKDYIFENFKFNLQNNLSKVPQQNILSISNKDEAILEIDQLYSYVSQPEDMLKKIDILTKENIISQEKLQFRSQEPNNNSNLSTLIITNLLFFGLSFLLFKNKLLVQNQPKVSSQFTKKLGITFDDVAGMKQVKEEMNEFVDFLKNPKKYQKLGAVMPKGALLTGPPGTGKTFLGKAVAGESGVPFFYMAGSEFIEKYVGVGAERIRALFKEAKRKSPSIIFIDELDAIARKRDGQSSHDEMQNTLNSLLVEMDGFTTNSKVIVFGSTNLPETLDQAILRPGRLDRTIEVSLPSIDEREAIFMIYLKKIQLNPEKSIFYYAKRLATLSPGFSGAEIKNVVNEAAIVAIRRDKSLVDDDDFEEAIERVIGGIERKSQTLEENKETVAVHESGHGVVSWFLEGGDPLLKITIKPRSKGALGFAQYLTSESNLYSQQELLDKIASILAGRCAEMEFFGKSSTGAYDDFQKAKKIAFEIVTTFGMSEDMKFVPFLLDENGNKYYSEKTHLKIDQAVEKIIKEQTIRCQNLIKSKKHLVQKLSDELLLKQVLIFTDIVKILGERPYKPKNNFKRFLDELKNNKNFETST